MDWRVLLTTFGIIFLAEMGDKTQIAAMTMAAEKKRPWDLGKSFAEAAPIGPVHPVAQVGHPNRGRIALDVNGETRQQGDLAAMIWDVPHVLHFLSQYYELLPGDLVFTGTPAGVGPVVPGDLLVGRIEGLGGLSVRIAPPR